MNPQVVAHRGAGGHRPEHSLDAYRAAYAAGADSVECDVRLSADGHLVCVHDRTVDRTSDGTGAVSTMTLEQLRSLDWGVRRADGGPGTTRHQVLTLRELFEFLRDEAPGLGVAVETKHPVRFGGRVEQALVELLTEFGWHGAPDAGPSPVRVMSFSRYALRRMRRLAPGLPLVLLFERSGPVSRHGRLPHGVTTAGIGIDLLRDRPGYVAHAHRRGNAVHVWTVDDTADVDLCLDLGVEALITDRLPTTLARVRGRTAGRTGRPGPLPDPSGPSPHDGDGSTGPGGPRPVPVRVV